MNYKYYTIGLECADWFFKARSSNIHNGEWEQSLPKESLYETRLPPKNTFIIACNEAKKFFNGTYCIRLIGYKDGNLGGPGTKCKVLMSKKVNCDKGATKSK